MISEIRELKLDSSRRQELQEDKKPLFPCAVYRGEVHSFVRQEIPLHWHPDLEMCVLDQGSIRVTLTGGAYLLHPGEGYFTNANIMHGINYNESGPCRYRSIVFDPSLLSGAPGSVFDAVYVRPFLESGPSFCILKGRKWAPAIAAFDRTWNVCREEPEGYEFAARTALSDTFLELKKNSSMQNNPRPAHLQELRMQSMISWLDEHYGEQVRLDDLAAAVHLSARECQRVFAGALRITPMEYLQKKRLGEAATLLSDSVLSITEIGYRCGFESPSYFTNQFGKAMGMSPRQYRRSIHDSQTK